MEIINYVILFKGRTLVPEFLLCGGEMQASLEVTLMVCTDCGSEFQNLV